MPCRIRLERRLSGKISFGCSRGQDQEIRRMKIELFDEAEKDLIDGFAFHERQSKGLGEYHCPY